jgi:anti-anti-sigma factor
MVGRMELFAHPARFEYDGMAALAAVEWCGDTAHLFGEIDISNAAVLQCELAAAGVRVVDLTHLSFVDSAGVAMFVELVARCGCVIRADGNVARVFAMLGVQSALV